ncbi:MAG: DUF433 domain-containing protein [Patescibacteria group bacterium]|nr:DUF433 domain-containing protein [Patescibacteria group bacterium]
MESKDTKSLYGKIISVVVYRMYYVSKIADLFDKIYLNQYIKYNMKYLISDPDILGGELVIKNTRVPLERILFLLKDGYNLEAIQEEYPQVDKVTLLGALDELGKVANKSLHDAQTA